MSEHPPASSTEHDPVEDLLIACLELPEAEWRDAVEAACAEHPEHAAALRRRFAVLQGSAMLETPAESGPTIPERLGHYRLLSALGRGGMGVVYLAEDETLGRQVALKLIRPEHLWFAGARERFRREVHAVASFDHAGIVPVYDVGEAEGIPYYTMERIRGASLADVLDALKDRSPSRLGPADLREAFARHLGPREPGSCEPASGEFGGSEVGDTASFAAAFGTSWTQIAIKIARQVAAALAHAHAHEVLHRDIKPSNLMVTPDGRVRILDFGLSISEQSPRMTRTGGLVGSIPYMAPEQLDGSPVDARTDVYQLGVTLYETLTLAMPHGADDSDECRRRILEGAPRPPRELNAALPPDVQTVCLCAMDPDPKRRYASAAAFERDLRNLLERRPIEAVPPGIALRTRRAVERHPTASVSTLLGVLLVVVLPLVLFGRERAAFAEIRTITTGIERLSDEYRLRELEERENALWPALPAQAEAMETWLADARALVARTPDHRATFDALSARAAGGVTPGPAPTEAISDEALQDALGSPADVWQYVTLAELLPGLAALEARIPRVRERLEVATTVHERTTLREARAWSEARARVARDRRFDGLDLAPQLGLVPLGPDPTTGLEEFAHVLTGTVPARDNGGRLVLGPDSGVVLVLIPGGTFTMGNDGGDIAERPAHDVTLVAFLIAKHEVTQAQWARATGSNPSAYSGGSPLGVAITPMHPVENVSWLDCDLWLGRLALVLPTEAQWEYAARGGQTTEWWTGDDLASLAGAANLADGGRDGTLARGLGIRTEQALDDGFPLHAPVDALRPNGFGLHHVAGNVSEWCRDFVIEYSNPARDGDGLRERNTADGFRAYRGGAWRTLASSARSGNRMADVATKRKPDIGVRPSRELAR